MAKFMRFVFATLVFPAILMVDGWRNTVADYKAYIRGDPLK